MKLTTTETTRQGKSGSNCAVLLVFVSTGATAFNQSVADFHSDFSIDVSSIPDGLYTLILQQGSAIIQQQTIMIQH